MNHAVNKITGSNDRPRIRRAEDSWDYLYRTGKLKPVHFKNPIRTAVDIGAKRKSPFLRDVVNYACLELEDWEWILLTNGDVGLVSDFPSGSLTNKPWFCRRRNWKRPVRAVTRAENRVRGESFLGADCFGFQVGWWKNEGVLGDYLLGFEGWDWILRFMILDSGGVEEKDLCWHEFHGSGDWKRDPVGIQWNLKLAQEWLNQGNHKRWAQYWPKGTMILEGKF